MGTFSKKFIVFDYNEKFCDIHVAGEQSEISIPIDTLVSFVKHIENKKAEGLERWKKRK